VIYHIKKAEQWLSENKSSGVEGIKASLKMIDDIIRVLEIAIAPSTSFFSGKGE
jgi:hypothetical protein